MASEAQRLIGISLTKIAQSRTHRGGVSLHKNLLVATVLQKARYIFMEEAYNMVHYQQQASVVPVQHHHPQQQSQQQQQVAQASMAHQQSQQQQQDDDDLVGLTVEEAGIEATPLPEAYLQPGCLKCAASQQQLHDKENQPPSYHNEQLTYLDLDKSNVLKERQTTTAAPTTTTTATATTNNPLCLKRRRAVTEWETEEAVQSILPKRRCPATPPPEDDSVFLDDATLLSEAVSKELEESQSQSQQSHSTTNSNNNTMEIDRITSLVSIFSFGMATPDGSNNASSGSSNKLTTNSNRSLTPDLCSSQAKESDTIQQRPFLAMTV